MEIDDTQHDVKDAPKDDEEEGQRVFKRRHTDEKPVIHAKALDDSQVEADKVAAELEAVEPSDIQLWDDLDADDWDDPVMVSEYVAEVCVYLKEIELATLPKADYMNNQEEITWEHRGILVDWLLQLHARYNLLAESLFLCINVLDRFLASRPISISKLQLVGVASFFIATKFEETYAPSVKELVIMTEKRCTVEEILKAERYILKTLQWDLRAPGPMGWLRRGSKADDCEVQARTIAKYLLEVGLVERRLVCLVPSLLSAASLWLARLILGREEWTPNLEHYTTYSEKELIPVASIMVEYVITNPIQHESLYKKYAHRRYFKCSVYVLHWSLERWQENGHVSLAKDIEFIKEELRRQREMTEAEDEDEEGS
ncbi:cyclin-like protein [Gymnopilus junonius]|uniref:Cyclin-like protein n=1 Tax=Gymnopilus junonius TaxID=109634 RepID=A0A9P5NM31_GYMJU|nr:cyclin-like protein [Gymnopilus junonius]